MQLIAIAAFIGSALALAQPEGLKPRDHLSSPFCTSVNSCITTNGNPASATSFCASYNSVPTTTTTEYYPDPSACSDSLDARQVVDVLAPYKPRCLKKFLDGRLSRACSCVVTDSTVTYTTSSPTCAYTP